MFRHKSFTRSNLLHRTIIITFILGKVSFPQGHEKQTNSTNTEIVVLESVNCILVQTKQNNTQTNVNQIFSAEIHDYESMDNFTEISPVNEGFILISNSRKKSEPLTMSSASAMTTVLNQISASRALINIPSTTCKTENQAASTSITTTTNSIYQRMKTYTENSNSDHSIGRLGRRLLVDRREIVDIVTKPIKTLIDNDNDVQGFLKVDPAELLTQLLSLTAVLDGSGYSKYNSHPI